MRELVVSIILVLSSVTLYAQEISPARVKEINKALDRFESAAKSQMDNSIKQSEQEILKMGVDAIPYAEKLFMSKSKDDSVRQKAMELAIKFKDEKVAASLMAVGRDKDEKWYNRVAAIENVGKLSNELRKEKRSVDKKYMKDLEACFEDTNSNMELKKEALRIYGIIGQNDALPVLKSKLDDPNDDIRFNAIYGIGGVRTPEGEDALIQGFLRDKDKQMQGPYTHLFGFYKIKKAIPYLIQDLKEVKGNKKEDVVRLKGYFRALGEIGDKSVIPILKKCTDLKDEDIDSGSPYASLAIAEDAAVALAKLGDYESIPKVVKLIEINGRIGKGNERMLRKLYRERTGQEVNY